MTEKPLLQITEHPKNTQRFEVIATDLGIIIVDWKKREATRVKL